MSINFPPGFLTQQPIKQPGPMPYCAQACIPCGPSQPTGNQSVGDTFTASGATAGSGSLLDRTGPVMQTTLANGTQGYLMQKPGMRKSAFILNIPTSALPPGVAELLTLSLLDGSLAAKQQREALRGQGIIISALKDDKFFSIMAETNAGQELAMTNAVMQLLTQPVQDPAMFNTMKSNMIQSERQNIAKPDARLDNAMAKRLFGPQSSSSRSSQQRVADMDAQTLPGVMAYHSSLLKLVGQGNALMVSPLPAETQRQTLMAAFGPLSSATTQASGNGLGAAFDAATLGRHQNVLLPNEALKRALIKVSWQAPDARDPDYAAFCLLRSILCDVGKNSFFDTLRTQHGLVYAIQYNTTGFQFPQGRAFTPSVKVEFSKIGQTIEDLRNVTQNLCQNEITLPQLQSVQREQFLKLREAAETSFETRDLYRPWLFLGAKPVNLQSMQAAINRVTPADIKRVANRIFNDPKSLQMMGISAPTAVLQQWFPGQPLEKIEE